MTTQNVKCNNMVVRIQIKEMYDTEDPSFYFSKRNSLLKRTKINLQRCMRIEIYSHIQT